LGQIPDQLQSVLDRAYVFGKRWKHDEVVWNLPARFISSPEWVGEAQCYSVIDLRAHLDLTVES
jgi:hypothetical protein